MLTPSLKHVCILVLEVLKQDGIPLLLVLHSFVNLVSTALTSVVEFQLCLQLTMKIFVKVANESVVDVNLTRTYLQLLLVASVNKLKSYCKETA